jgi:hypothetical protein
MRQISVTRLVLYIIIAMLQFPAVSMGDGTSPGYRMQRDFFLPVGGPSSSAGYRMTGALGSLAAATNAQSTNYTMVAGAALPHQVAIMFALQLGFSGTGGGSVNSLPGGLACTGGLCSASFIQGSSVTLVQLPDSNSLFSGWSGACTNLTGNCVVAMTGPRSLTSAFTASAPLRLVGSTTTDFALLQGAYDAAQSANVIQGRDVVLTGDLVAGTAKTVTINGGYDPAFASRAGNLVLNGKMLVRSGKVIASEVKIR